MIFKHYWKPKICLLGGKMKKILLVLAIVGMFVMPPLIAASSLNDDSKEITLLLSTISLTLSGDGKKVIIWDKDIVLQEDYIVKENQTLIIKQGVTIYLEGGTSIVIKGELKAVGNKSNPINFRGNEFRKIYVDGGNAVFKYCRIENTIEGINFKNSQFVIQNCIIVSSIFHGIASIDSEGEIANNTIINVSMGIYASGSSVLIKNNTIINPDIGIQISYKDSSSVISNTIQNYKEWGIRISSCKNVKIKNNTFLNGKGEGRLSQEWYLIVKVKDIFGFSIDNAWVTIYDSKGRKVIEEKTSSKYSGNNEPIAGDVVSQYIINNNGTKIILSPYTIHVQKNEKEKTVTVDLDRDVMVSIKLPVFTIPSIIVVAMMLIAIIAIIFLFIHIKCKSKR